MYPEGGFSNRRKTKDQRNEKKKIIKTQERNTEDRTG